MSAKLCSFIYSKQALSFSSAFVNFITHYVVFKNEANGAYIFKSTMFSENIL